MNILNTLSCNDNQIIEIRKHNNELKDVRNQMYHKGYYLVIYYLIHT